MNNLNNKRAQVGEGLTWLVATIIILLVLGASIALTNKILKPVKNIFGNAEKELLYDPATDLIVQKSFTGLLLSRGKNSETIFDELKKEDFSGKKFDEINSIPNVKLLKSVFGGIYFEEFHGVLDLGIPDEGKNLIDLPLNDLDLSDSDRIICENAGNNYRGQESIGFEEVLLEEGRFIQIVFPRRFLENEK